ncbi:hypothetical protein D3C84_320550 [compost metagenome]
MLDQIVIRRIRAAGHHNQSHAGVGRLDLCLTGHQQHLEPPFEGELDHLILGRLGAGIGIYPHTHGRCFLRL